MTETTTSPDPYSDVVDTSKMSPEDERRFRFQTHDVRALLGPERLRRRDEIAAMQLPPGTYYRDRDGKMHEIDFERTESSYTKEGVAGRPRVYQPIRRPQVDVVCDALAGGVVAARGKYATSYNGFDRDGSFGLMIWDNCILDYWIPRPAKVKKSFWTGDPADDHAGIVTIDKVSLRTRNSECKERRIDDVVRRLSILAVMEEASRIGLGSKNPDPALYPHQYNDVLVRGQAAHLNMKDIYGNIMPGGLIDEANLEKGDSPFMHDMVLT